MNKGLITPFTIDSHPLNRTVKLGIYFPEDYSPFETHTLFICFDGQDVSQIGQIHRKYERLKGDGLEAAIFVFIHYTDAAERRTEYHPDGVQRQAYQQFIVSELLPYLQHEYHLSIDPSTTVLLGDSLAASIALTLVLDYPELAVNACLLSPMITDDILQQTANLPENHAHALNIFLIIGNSEDNFKLMTGESADFLNPVRKFQQVLCEKHIQHHYEELDGGHSWKTWQPQIERVLNYFLD